MVQDANFRLLVFPRGSSGDGGRHISAFVELVEDDRQRKIKYQIELCNVSDSCKSIRKSESAELSQTVRDRGWHDFIPIADVSEEAGWVNAEGVLRFRATVGVNSILSISARDASTKDVIVDVQANALDSVASLRALIEGQLADGNRYVLAYGSQRLRESETLTAANVVDGCVLDLVHCVEALTELPYLADNQVELVVRDMTTWQCGQEVRSASLMVQEMNFRLLVFPCGSPSDGGQHIGAFVELVEADRTCLVRYQIELLNLLDNSKSVRKREDLMELSPRVRDRGWHSFFPVGEVSEEAGWLSAEGLMVIRASIELSAPLIIKTRYVLTGEEGVVVEANSLDSVASLRALIESRLGSACVLSDGTRSLQDSETLFAAGVADGGTIYLAQCVADMSGLPALAANQLELVVRDVPTWSCGQAVRSESLMVEGANFRLLVFPGGTWKESGRYVGAFVELVDKDISRHIKYEIEIVNFFNNARSVRKREMSVQLSPSVRDRGWHDFLLIADVTEEAGWVDAYGSMVIRASICSTGKAFA